MKEKIFVSAYACEPGLGSEIGVGWHWVLEMSKYFELWVLTRESNRHTIEPWISEHPEYGGIHFLYYDWPKWARFWKKGLRGVRTYYNLWQLCTNGIVKRTMQEHGIRIFHHLTYGNVLWKVSSYGQKQFFVWGPVGGLETIPVEYSRHYVRKSRLIEAVRRLTVRMLPVNLGFRTRCRNADLILCKTDITRNLIPERQRHKAMLFTDVAVERQEYIQAPGHNEASGRVNLITVGRLDAWRGFDLCIEALAEAARNRPDLHLTIIGNGTDELRLKALADTLGVSSMITFTGRVSGKEYQRLLAESDIVVNGSLKEGAVTVSFDSMAMGKPLICLDTTGYTRYFSNDYAVVIPISNRDKVIRDMADGILKLSDETVRRKIGRNALTKGRQFSWENRGLEIYRLLTEKFDKYVGKS